MTILNSTEYYIYMTNENRNFLSLSHREYKDRLFKAIFGGNTDESKRWRLELYNALNDSHYTDPDALKVNTIENVIYITMHNDISFLIDDHVVLWEQQSSYNKNMPLRGFLYFSQLYQEYLTENKKDPCRNGEIKIPTPKFIVFYNGLKHLPDEFTMKLSDSFMQEDKTEAYEWTAYIKNINKNPDQVLQKKCKPLYHYCKFVDMVRNNLKNGMGDHEAINKAVDDAIKANLLDGFFRRQKAEVIGMILTEFNQEIYEENVREDGYLEGYDDGRNTGIIEGIARGESKKAAEDAKNLLKENIPPEIISRCTGIPLAQVMELAT